MWINMIFAFLIALGLLPLAVVAYSFARTAGGRRYDTRFFEKDRIAQPRSGDKRRYQGAGHLVIRAGDLLRYAYPLLRVYVFRAIPPGFREKIMIVTAMGNSCPQ